MKKIAAIFAFIFLVSSMGIAQQSVDKSIQFPPGMGFRNYHIYIPSGYDINTPHKLMVGFHPFNTNRWDGRSWRDSLITFAENADLLLICPDGGSDGRIDGQDDYEFIKAMIDSMHSWYNIDVESRFGIGFSVGGKAVYEFGLNHRSTFKGLIPIGAAMNGTSTVDDVLYKAKCQNYYIIHGSQDAPTQRYYPIKDSLEANEANVDVTLMGSVGHTFDFPNRNQILLQGFRYIDTVSCNYSGIIEKKVNDEINVYPTILDRGQPIFVNHLGLTDNMEISIYNMNGSKMTLEMKPNSNTQMEIQSESLSSGLYILTIKDPSGIHQQKILIR